MKHPDVTVLDPPDAIQHVYNRQSMLQDVAALKLSDAYGNPLEIYFCGHCLSAISLSLKEAWEDFLLDR